MEQDHQVLTITLTPTPNPNPYPNPYSLTRWDEARLRQQKKHLRKAVKALAKAYCEYKMLTNADHEDYADEVL